MFPSYRNHSVDLLCKSTGFYMMGTMAVKGLNYYISLAESTLISFSNHKLSFLHNLHVNQKNTFFLLFCNFKDKTLRREKYYCFSFESFMGNKKIVWFNQKLLIFLSIMTPWINLIYVRERHAY